uniref:Uncharacterized protein n=1 Tax=Nelumbo nucifera TaxID=4432 RepID=A0A822YIS2_NELNU|nr:TPA_asm: hypothetical protein HUJ06_011331 [Nelumbo nucifera]
MPLHRPYLNPSNANVIKCLTHQCKPSQSQLRPVAPTTKYPSLDILSFLQKCRDKDQLSQIQAQMISTGLIHHLPAASKLVVSFASNPLVEATCIARLIAEQIEGLDIYTWNAVIRGYLEGESPKEAILVYAHVRRKGLKVDSYSLMFAIKACRLILGMREGEEIHSQVFKMGFLSEIITRTALLHFYGVFGNPESAQQVFDESPRRDSALWNALIAAYAHRSYLYKALSVACAMINDCVRPNGVAVVSILSACSSLTALREGKMLHCYVLRNLIDVDVFVANALIDMYSKCRCLFNAHQLFQRMPMKNVISWTSIINGYSNSNFPDGALALFKEMERAKVRPDEITMLGIVSMCSKLGRFEPGEWIDNYVEKNGFKKGNVCMENALMDMHAKCGNIKKACQIFEQMEKKTVVSWTSIIHGLALHGKGIPALLRFSQMQREGFRPDCIVFLSILSACSHAGLVDEGRKCFKSMIEDYSITPWMEHYGCMVDLLCRAGLLDDAFEFVGKMPINPDVIVYRMLLGACKNQGNISLAKRIMNYLTELEPRHSGNYILMSNCYASMGEWDNAKQVRTNMVVRGVVKLDPACSEIQVN